MYLLSYKENLCVQSVFKETSTFRCNANSICFIELCRLPLSIQISISDNSVLRNIINIMDLFYDYNFNLFFYYCIGANLNIFLISYR
jgi:hypothetical protein